MCRKVRSNMWCPAGNGQICDVLLGTVKSGMVWPTLYIIPCYLALERGGRVFFSFNLHSSCLSLSLSLYIQYISSLVSSNCHCPYINSPQYLHILASSKWKNFWNHYLQIFQQRVFLKGHFSSEHWMLFLILKPKSLQKLETISCPYN